MGLDEHVNITHTALWTFLTTTLHHCPPTPIYHKISASRRAETLFRAWTAPLGLHPCTANRNRILSPCSMFSFQLGLLPSHFLPCQHCCDMGLILRCFLEDSLPPMSFWRPIEQPPKLPLFRLLFPSSSR